MKNWLTLYLLHKFWPTWEIMGPHTAVSPRVGFPQKGPNIWYPDIPLAFLSSVSIRTPSQAFLKLKKLTVSSSMIQELLYILKINIISRVTLLLEVSSFLRLVFRNRGSFRQRPSFWLALLRSITWAAWCLRLALTSRCCWSSSSRPQKQRRYPG